MESVAEGYSKVVNVKGYRIAAKTGTAEVAGSDGRLTSIVADFAGMIPADNPRFAITVIMKDPQGTYGGMTAGPMFAKIGEFLMQKYNVPTSSPAQRCYCSGLVRGAAPEIRRGRRQGTYGRKAEAMSAVSEAVARRMTLGYLADTYGLELDPDFASGVTVTSIADDVDSVAPGSLYVPAQSVDVKRLEEARARGAYAALVPPSMKHEDGPAQMPLLRARLTSRQLGDIASDIAGTPSNALAIFVVGSDDPKRSERYASCVADFLHMLGNPVGVVKSSGSTSRWSASST